MKLTQPAVKRIVESVTSLSGDLLVIFRGHVIDKKNLFHNQKRAKLVIISFYPHGPYF